MMGDIFESRTAKPMLISSETEPFDSSEYIFELKLDGERCIAYLDKNGTELINKRNVKMISKMPELAGLHKQVKGRCILDGELMVSIDGKPSFDEIKRRSLTSNRFKIESLSKKYPAVFTAFDILYYDGEDVCYIPLIERKKLLEKVIIENEYLARSRFIEDNGIALYNLTVAEDLEGVIAKQKNGIYRKGEKTKDWVKIKNLKDDDFVVCGYIIQENAVASIILGQYSGDKMVYIGHVILGLSRAEFDLIRKQPQVSSPFEKREEGAVYIAPNVVCVAKFMHRTANGGLRQPVFKGLRFDKEPKECVLKK
jgi:bifunctional non-homologous end joining protein LigD/DNA ligase-1